MNRTVPHRKKNILLFALLLVPLCLYLWVAGRHFQADRYTRKARAEGDRIPAALEWMERALRANPADGDAWNDLGNLYQLMALREDPSHPERIALLKQAGASYQASIRRATTVVTSHMDLGWVWYQIDREEGRPPRPSVKASFERAVLLAPFNYYAHILLADYLLYEGNREEGFRALRRAIEALPYDEVIKTVLSMAKAQTTEYEQLKQAIPEDVALAQWYFAIDLAHRLGLREEGKETFRKVLRMKPRNTYYRDGFLQSCMNLGDVPCAILEVEEREKVLGEDPAVLLRLADFLKKQGEFDQAMDLVRRVQRIAPGLSRTTTLQAEIETARGNLLEAARTYEALLQRNPRDPEAHFRLGLIYQQHGNRFRAVEMFLQAAALAPEQVRYQGRLAEAYLRLGMLERALDVLQRCRRLAPEEIRFHLMAGNIYLGKEDWMEAARAFGDALKRSPDHPEALKGFLTAHSRIP